MGEGHLCSEAELRTERINHPTTEAALSLSSWRNPVTRWL